MTDRFLIDECLSAALVATAKARGYESDWVPHIGKRSWQDWSLAEFAIANDYIVVTLNRRDFLKLYAKRDIHPGLVILLLQSPQNQKVHQIAVFEAALKTFAAPNADLVNKLLEVRSDGSVHIREWNAQQHDINHINNIKRS